MKDFLEETDIAAGIGTDRKTGGQNLSITEQAVDINHIQKIS
jgi:hypothetical protein